MTPDQKERLRREAAQHEQNAGILLTSVPIPTYEDGIRADAEMQRAKDKRALADSGL